MYGTPASAVLFAAVLEQCELAIEVLDLREKSDGLPSLSSVQDGASRDH